MISRREALTRISTAAGIAAFTPRMASAQAQAAQKVDPPSVISNPPRDFSQPVSYPDPDIITIDPSFNALRVGNTPIQRLWTGAMWCEGPAWNGQGRYLVWSDIPNNRQYRWLDDDGHVSVFRSPSNFSNGNTFDPQGRQLSCEHASRRVVRYEHDGSVTVIAERFQGKRLNSPNDVVVHRDGAVWFTDPPYGAQLYEGGASRVPQRELPTSVYRV